MVARTKNSLIRKGQLVFLFLLITDGFAKGLSQLNVQIGALQGQYSGAGTGRGNFSVAPNVINLEYDIFYNNRISYFGKMVLAMNLSTGKAMYNYSGVGQKFYFWSQGSVVNDSNTIVYMKSVPKIRFYTGWDIGISRIIVDEFGPALNATSTLIDFGTYIGFIKQVEETWGLNLQSGLSYGYGFSTVAVTGFSFRFLIGGSYYFF